MVVARSAPSRSASPHPHYHHCGLLHPPTAVVVRDPPSRHSFFSTPQLRRHLALPLSSSMAGSMVGYGPCYPLRPHPFFSLSSIVASLRPWPPPLPFPHPPPPLSSWVPPSPPVLHCHFIFVPRLRLRGFNFLDLWQNLCD